MSETCKGCQYGQLIRVKGVVSTYPDIPVVIVKTQCCLRRETFSGRGPGCPRYDRGKRQ